MQVFHVALGLLPVCVFLLGLTLLDSFKLVPPRAVLRSLAVGAAAAAVCLYVNSELLNLLSPSPHVFSRYIAPVVEEVFKVAFLLYLIRTKRVGFLVDAAIYAFAIGAGFALVENIYFLAELDTANTLVWVVRGFGTAALHGATLIVAGVITKTLYDRKPDAAVLPFIPGVAAGIILHSAFNHFVLSPVMSTVVLLLVFPIVVTVVFEVSDRATRHWLVAGWDSDIELLEAITEGDIGESAIGKYLDNLHGKFPPEVIADMLCLLHIYLELTMTAKGVLLAREAGMDLPTDAGIADKFAELRYLEKTIGKTGLLTLHPLLPTGAQDAWQKQLLATG